MSTLLKVNPVDPPDFGPFENPWANPIIPGSSGQHYARGRHGGLDFKSVWAVAVFDGVVRWRDYGPAYGLQVQIDNRDGIEATYSHLASRMFTSGSMVQAGYTLGRVGATGNVTGPHLHFELHDDPGNWWSDFDPQPYVEEIMPLNPAEIREIVRQTVLAIFEGQTGSNPGTPDLFTPAQWNSVKGFTNKTILDAIAATPPGGIGYAEIVAAVKDALKEGTGV